MYLLQVATNVNDANTAANYLPIGMQLFFAIGFVALMMGLTHFLGPKRKTSDKLENFREWN